MPVRRRLLAALATALLLAPLAVTHGRTQAGRVESCVSPAAPVRIGNTVACEHADVAPPGVRVHRRVSTTKLKKRRGAGRAAYRAAQDLGVAGPVSLASSASSPDVPCDGDGTSGYRVQGMYVVEAGRTNRYSALLSSFRLWAAGTDDVVNRSAALTGGVRHLRYVTDPGASGSCVANVLNVTVPAGSMTSFGATVAAVQALGYTSPGRKYLMWTDATVLCGVASMYTNDGATQGNPNNGAYPQYARVDSGCWGLGDGASQHSVEAHELLHTLGGVQSTAPHSTKVGHCWDESDTMCYADGGAYAMRQICPVEREYFFDCNNDDYFSTFPDPGGYLASHWNAADSRFLIGGGDGTGGGTLGSPSVLGATIAVNNPAVPGLSTQVSVTPALPDGRTLASVTWKSARADCTFGTPKEVQSTVTCSATATGSTTVTATLVDSTGATKTVSSPLTFLTGTARPVQVALTVAGQSTSDTATASVCTAASFPVVARVVDVATGAPVKGLAVTVTRKTATTTLASVGSGATTPAGTVTLTQVASVSTDYAARTTTSTVYAVGTSPTLTAVPQKCTLTMSASKDKTSSYYADPVTVTGILTRSTATGVVPVWGAPVTIRSTAMVGGVPQVTTLGSGTSAADGTFRVVVKPTLAGALSAEVLASTAYEAVKVAVGDLTVALPQTSITAIVDRTDVGYGSTITATGRLDRVAGTNVTALAGKSVGLFVTPIGKVPVQVGTGVVTSTGTWTASGPLRYSGALVARFAGVTGQPAAQVALGDVVAGTWETTLSASASASQVLLGGTLTVSGTLTRSYLGVSQPAAGVAVSLYFQATGSSTRTLTSSVAVSATGAFSMRVYPKSSGTWTVVLANVAGYANASSASLPVTVG